MVKKLLFIALILVGFNIMAQNQIPIPLGSSNFGSKITVLTNGNYVIADINWSGIASNAGAVYLYNGKTHTVISRLTGSSADDQIGLDGIIALPSGNFVVISSQWNNGSIRKAGAVTWCNGITGIEGEVNSSNSLIGGSVDDMAGYEKKITVLANGNYVVCNPSWNHGNIIDAGAVTWGNGNAGVSGVISSSNSLTGTSSNDEVGRTIDSGKPGVTALTNGNYVVSSVSWNNRAGAATWGDGTKGIVGPITITNSLISTNSQTVISAGGITALANGNYIVSSPFWNDATPVYSGAVTWGNGTTGTVGTITIENSLVSMNTNSNVGLGGIVALPNSNYLVVSPYWDNGSIQDVVG